MTRVPIRVLIVDDDALVRSGLTMMLGGASTVEVVGEASDGSEVLGAIDRHRPDVLLLDLRMPKVDGLETMGLVRGQPRPPRVLVLTTFDTDDHVLSALRSGAAGFLVKDTPPAEIVRRASPLGRHRQEPCLGDAVGALARQPGADRAHGPGRRAGLTRWEPQAHGSQPWEEVNVCFTVPSRCRR